MILVVGLGNPGEQYAGTYHNLGFLAVDRLAERHGIRVTRPDSKALTGAGAVAGKPVLLAKPQTYMNLSGVSVAPLMEKHSISPADLVVVYDDLDLPWMSIRVRRKGSAGGHHGMESLIRELKTEDFVRVRLGIHPGRPVRDGAEFVLSPFRRPQLKELDEVLERAAEAIESIIAEGVEKSMTKFNRRAPGLQAEEE
jgi:PTH1 family peptidyl-tRNA hydrolase